LMPIPTVGGADIDRARPIGKSKTAPRAKSCSAQALDGHLATPLKEVLEQAVERFDCLRGAVL